MRTMVVAALASLCASSAHAQIRASELAWAGQVVDGTKIMIEYHRPAVRGRTPFGGIVHWGEVWTPGANWATTLEVDGDIRLAGQSVAKGKYSLWLVPRQSDDWTLFVHPKERAYHTQRPDTTAAVARILLKPLSGQHAERLTFSFPTVTPEGTVLQLEWGSTRLELPVRVQPSRPIALDRATMESYTGTYQLPWGNGMRMHVFLEGEKLRARIEPDMGDYDAVFDLVPSSKERFNPQFYMKGAPYDVEDFIIVFDLSNPAAPAVEWRGIADEVLTRGLRLPR